MQRRVSAFNGYTIEALDGKAGTVSDILFEDNSWKLRWFVINTGSWLMGRKLLIHPSTLGQPDIRERAFSVSLSMARIEESPEIGSDPPVAMQMCQIPNEYSGASQSWIDGLGLSAGSMYNMSDRQNYETMPAGDPHLRSLAEVTGYHVHGLDGDIGHVEDFLVDDESWSIDYAVIDTKNWGFGKHVLVSPAEIKEVNWAKRYIRLDMTRYKIKCSPSWQEPDWSDRAPG